MVVYGELLNIRFPDNKLIEYIHDPLGRMIAKKVNGVIIEKYLWQGLTRLLAVLDGNNSLYKKAALKGETTALLKMIEFYIERKGVSQNNTQAYAWILLTETKIPPESVYGKMLSKKKKNLLSHLSPTEIKNAEEEFRILLKSDPFNYQ